MLERLAATSFFSPHIMSARRGLRAHTAAQIAEETQRLISWFKNVQDTIVGRESRTWDSTWRSFHEANDVVASAAGELCLPSMVSTQPDVRQAATESKTALGDMWRETFARRDLFEALQAGVEGRPDGAEKEHLVRQTLAQFSGAGVSIDDAAQRAEFIKLGNEVSTKCAAFFKNINDDASHCVFTADELAGCPEPEKQLAVQDDGTFRADAKAPHSIFVMKYAERAETRRRMYVACASRCAQVNGELLADIVRLRHRQAELLGFPSHAAFKAQSYMAPSEEAINAFLTNLLEGVRAPLARDVADLKAIRKDVDGTDEAEALQLYDFARLGRLYRERKLDVDENSLREFFPTRDVLPKILRIYEGLFGIRFTEVAPGDDCFVRAEDVRMFDIADESGEALGTFLLDLFPRPGKYSHQCVVAVLPSCVLESGERQLPMAMNIGNLPETLSPSELRTFFHEFGHGVHAVCTRSETSIQSWTWPILPYPGGVELDALEYPSQMLENFMYDPSVLVDKLSGHAQTGAKLDRDIAERLGKGKHVLNGYRVARQATMSLYDMAIHGAVVPDDLEALWTRMMADIGMPAVPDTHYVASWNHLVCGYDAGYFSYLWSEIVADDVFSAFANVDDRETGLRYRQQLLEPGASLPSSVILQKFLGRTSDQSSFLDGIRDAYRE